MAEKTLVRALNFEVFGRVQGVFFRKNTQETARKLGLVGWVRNTEKGTVVGVIQGPNEKLQKMKTWLKEVGSPRSKIERCEFSERDVTTDRDDFSIIGRGGHLKVYEKGRGTHKTKCK
ncbi:acylphosphatase-2-like [Oscarella lobularis]|uniref:acylphosphatase-2-like n=1 Tax=Oscarella lobularis TaxID=121494 RepID=UPI0033142FC1